MTIDLKSDVWRSDGKNLETHLKSVSWFALMWLDKLSQLPGWKEMKNNYFCHILFYLTPKSCMAHWIRTWEHHEYANGQHCIDDACTFPVVHVDTLSDCHEEYYRLNLNGWVWYAIQYILVISNENSNINKSCRYLCLCDFFKLSYSGL